MHDLAGRPRGVGFLADHHGTLLTSHEAVDGLPRLVLHAVGGQTCVVDAHAVTPLPARDLALVRTEGLGVDPLPLTRRDRIDAGTYVRIAAGCWREARVLAATQVTYTATDRFHLVDDALELAIGTAGRDALRLGGGAAGGPVLDALTGAVLGVLGTALHSAQRDTGFAAPLRFADGPHALAELLARNEATVPAYGADLNLAGVLELAATSVAQDGPSAAAHGAGATPFVERLALTRDLSAFAAADTPVLALVGAPGTGRTTELATLAARRTTPSPLHTPNLAASPQARTAAANDTTTEPPPRTTAIPTDAAGLPSGPRGADPTPSAPSPQSWPASGDGPATQPSPRTAAIPTDVAGLPSGPRGTDLTASAPSPQAWPTSGDSPATQPSPRTTAIPTDAAGLRSGPRGTDPTPSAPPPQSWPAAGNGPATEPRPPTTATSTDTEARPSEGHGAQPTALALVTTLCPGVVGPPVAGVPAAAHGREVSSDADVAPWSGAASWQMAGAPSAAPDPVPEPWPDAAASSVADARAAAPAGADQSSAGCAAQTSDSAGVSRRTTEPSSGLRCPDAAHAVGQGHARPAPTLWLRGADLHDADGSLADAVRRSLGRAARIVAAARGVRVDDLGDVGAERLARLAGAAGRPLLLVLDGPEEMPPVLAHRLTEWTRGTVEWLRQNGVRLVMACREEYWERAGREFPDELLHGSADAASGLPACVRLGDLTADEAEHARRHYGIPGGALVEPDARHPLTLRFLADLRAALPGTPDTPDSVDSIADTFPAPGTGACPGMLAAGMPGAPAAGMPGAPAAGTPGMPVPGTTAAAVVPGAPTAGTPGMLASGTFSTPAPGTPRTTPAPGTPRTPPALHRHEVFAAHLDLMCLRIAVRLAAENGVRGTAVRRLAVRVAGQVHEAARRSLGPGQGELDRESFEAVFPWGPAPARLGGGSGWASAVLTEGLLVPAGDGYRFAHEELADWIQGLHLDLDEALHALVHRPRTARAAHPLPVPHHRVGPVVEALLLLGRQEGPRQLSFRLRELTDALDLDPASWWAARLLGCTLLQVPDASPYTEVLRLLADRVVSWRRAQRPVPAEFRPDFWSALPLPDAERLDLLRRLLFADAGDRGAGGRHLDAVARLLAAAPTAVQPHLTRWFDDERPLPATPHATVATAAQAMLHTHRHGTLDDLTEVLADSAHRRADELLAVLAEEEPSAVCRAVDRWAHDERPARRSAAVTYGLRAAPHVLTDADRDLLRYAALTLLARPADRTLHGGALALLVRDPRTRDEHFDQGLRHFAACDPRFPPSALGPALTTHPGPVLDAFRARLRGPDAGEALRTLTDATTPGLARDVAAVVRDAVALRPETAGHVAACTDRRLDDGPAARAALLPLVTGLLDGGSEPLRAALATVLGAAGTTASRPLRRELLDVLLAREEDPAVLDAVLHAAAGHRNAPRQDRRDDPRQDRRGDPRQDRRDDRRRDGRRDEEIRELVHRTGLLLVRTPDGAARFDRGLVDLSRHVPGFAATLLRWLTDTPDDWAAVVGPSARRTIEHLAGTRVPA
ncbi:trypsin-like peptidase domain-containing protein [Streptomyces sp. L2]|uniref:trypsin-like peptidase domain-containing protein n=1 Tax=Streptomyces sp. L2 TaxID=2162665 RepID=UPI001F50CA34|nr:trypsin-like peptidase domain-containing protein [Streptomyces sp. L2]